MDSMTPREFYDRFTRPAIDHWLKHQGVDHLAVHALSQLAILSDVAAANASEEGYRRRLEEKHAVLRTIREAHNSHKHGWPGENQKRKHFNQGQRVEETLGVGFFAGVSFIGGPPTPYKFMGIDDGDIEAENVGAMILDGLLAWQRELGL
ncbi:hypothetical protein [Agrobacterium rosae]|uniref:hypothetical protein n=1 Tax=Agrobacterium rosae TaxID=1972867 RepID=UPI003A7FAAAC